MVNFKILGKGLLTFFNKNEQLERVKMSLKVPYYIYETQITSGRGLVVVAEKGDIGVWILPMNYILD